MIDYILRSVLFCSKARFELTILVVIATDYLGSCKSNTIRSRPRRPLIIYRKDRRTNKILQKYIIFPQSTNINWEITLENISNEFISLYSVCILNTNIFTILNIYSKTMLNLYMYKHKQTKNKTKPDFSVYHVFISGCTDRKSTRWGKSVFLHVLDFLYQ
jgi:hypothetical protein